MIPICITATLAGFLGASWVMPKIFDPAPIIAAHPEGNTHPIYSPEELLTAFGIPTNSYLRKTQAGSYLSSQFAQRHKDWESASEFMDYVLNEDSSNASLQKSAMILNMGAGDHSEAIAQARNIYEQGEKDLLTLLFVAAGDFKDKKTDKAISVLNEIPSDNAASFLQPVLKLWTNALNDEISLKEVPQNPIYGYHALLALDYLQRPGESRDFIETTLNNDITDIRDLDKVADLLASHGETDRALALYKKVQELGFTTNVIDQKIIRIGQKQDIDDLLNLTEIKSPYDGIALVFQDMAEILYRDSNDDSALVFIQMALYLNEESNSARILHANILARHDRYDEAIDAFSKITYENKLYKTAQKQMASLYAVQEKSGKAIQILNDLYKKDNDVELLIQVGDIYRSDEEYKKSVEIYNKAAQKWKGDVPDNYWYLLYARGMSHERLKNFKKSEVDLEKALEYRPDHPYILNYLGYSLADQGRRLEDSLKMIEKAVEILPNDGHIADSLGWVLYRMERYEEALPHLENAIELLPYDPIVNDHLGDAYWRAGRKTEARFQWQRAVNYSDDSVEDQEVKAIALEKLQFGLSDEKENSLAETVQNKKN